jgi:hypothetical protein
MADELALLHQHQLEEHQRQRQNQQTFAPTTPKRKRPSQAAGLLAEDAAVPKFSFRSDDGTDSNGDPGCLTPRSSMALRFRGLALEQAGGGAPADAAAAAPAAFGELPNQTTMVPTATTDPRGNGASVINNNNRDNININNTTPDIDIDIGGTLEHDSDFNDVNTDTFAMRKRQRIPRAASAGAGSEAAAPEVMAEISSGGVAPTADSSDASNNQAANFQVGPDEVSSASTRMSASPVPIPIVPLSAMGTSKATGRRPSLQRSLPSINRFTKPKVRPAGQTPSPPADAPVEAVLGGASKSKSQFKNGQAAKKRAGTPPLKTRSTKPSGISPPTSPDDSAEEDDDDETLHIIDPLRASLTWHEDEITVYDPDDSDDDGLGFDGVGFKPSPLVAEARAAKRRQQLLEYRRREETEARDRRSQRRRAAVAAAAAEATAVAVGAMASGDEVRKVRFMDMDAPCVALTS